MEPLDFSEGAKRHIVPIEEVCQSLKMTARRVKKELGAAGIQLITIDGVEGYRRSRIEEWLKDLQVQPFLRLITEEEQRE